MAQDALLSALERWPETGIPDNPGAWHMTTAKHRAVDEGRRTAVMDAKHSELEYAAASWTSLDVESLDEPIEDDVLRLMLIASHPVLSKDARVALTLRLIAGLSTAEIARAFPSLACRSELRPWIMLALWRFDSFAAQLAVFNSKATAD